MFNLEIFENVPNSVINTKFEYVDNFPKSKNVLFFSILTLQQ